MRRSSSLVRYLDRICTYQMILAAVWGAAYSGESAYAHAYVHRLRTKLADCGHHIETVPDVGY